MPPPAARDEAATWFSRGIGLVGGGSKPSPPLLHRLSTALTVPYAELR